MLVLILVSVSYAFKASAIAPMAAADVVFEVFEGVARGPLRLVVRTHPC
jgi:hypothetical protein